MAEKYMTDALQNAHPEVPFASVGDDTIAALMNLAAIFKLKLQQAPSFATQAPSAKVVPRPGLAPSSTQILKLPVSITRQTRSQTKIHAQDIPNGSQTLSPRNLSQDDFYGMDAAHMAITLGNNHWSQRHQAHAVIHPVTGKVMEYSALMKDPHLQPLWTRGLGNECGRLFQGIRYIPGTHTCFFVDLKNVPNDIKITYGKHLGTPLPRLEYMKMLLSRFPEEIIQKYNLNAVAVDGWVYIEIRKRHVRFEASRTPCQSITSNSIGTIWILPSTTHPGTLITQDSANLFRARCRRLRCQIRRQATCRASPERPIPTL
jgi:hypothetical protein